MTAYGDFELNPELSGIRLDANAVVHRVSDALLTPEVAFRRLNRDMPQQELNLFKFTTCALT